MPTAERQGRAADRQQGWRPLRQPARRAVRRRARVLRRRARVLRQRPRVPPRRPATRSGPGRCRHRPPRRLWGREGRAVRDQPRAWAPRAARAARAARPLERHRHRIHRAIGRHRRRGPPAPPRVRRVQPNRRPFPTSLLTAPLPDTGFLAAPAMSSPGAHRDLRARRPARRRGAPRPGLHCRGHPTRSSRAWWAGPDPARAGHRLNNPNRSLRRPGHRRLLRRVRHR
jgi:hypothetical protein